MADTFVNSWDNTAQMFTPLWLQPATEDASNDDVKAALAYQAKHFRQVIGAVYKKQGVIDEGDFTITAGVGGTIDIGRGTVVIQNPTYDEGLYIVQADPITGMTVPIGIGSSANNMRVVIEMADKADAPLADQPDQYGWRYRIMQSDTGTALPTAPNRSYTIATLSRTGSGTVGIDQTMKLTAAAGGGTAWHNFSTFYSTWTAYGGGYAPPRYRRTNDGQVMLDGMLRAGSSSGSSTGAAEYGVVLPVGFRPAYPTLVPCMGRSNNVLKAIRAQINTDGKIYFWTGDSDGLFNASTDWVSLANVNFFASGY